MVPVLTLAVDGADRSLFGGAYVVDNFALAMKAVFLLAGYVVVLLSTNYIAEGDYYEGEYYLLLLSSILGMTVMASARDLVTIFVALELLSIPAYMLAAWRKRDGESNEAGLKYYLMGVFAVGRDALRDVADLRHHREHHPDRHRRRRRRRRRPRARHHARHRVRLVGFAFKVSAVPFHTWAPDTYEGAPTPITAFLSVASKTAGFVAILQLVFVAFFDRADVYEPMFWVLAVLTMTVGNLIALRQTNVVRLFAYSSVAQAGYMLAPLAVAGSSSGGARTSRSARWSCTSSSTPP